jgi:hypothetical protein
VSGKARGCLVPLAAVTLFWSLGILAARLLPLGEEPRTAAERLYHDNAVAMRHFLNDHPVARLVSRVTVYRVSLRGLRYVPNSCSGASVTGLEQMADVVAEVTDHSLFGLPIRRYEVSCAGNAIRRGPADYGRRPPPSPAPDRQALELDPPPPPPSPPPAPSGR